MFRVQIPDRRANEEENTKWCKRKKSMTDINGIILYLSTQNQNLLFTQNPNAFHYSEQLVALLSFYLKWYPNVSQQGRQVMIQKCSTSQKLCWNVKGCMTLVRHN